MVTESLLTAQVVAGRDLPPNLGGTAMYNGWKNYQTWNVALWIGKDEYLYNLAKSSGGYLEFVHSLRETLIQDISWETPDGVAWNDSGLDREALDELIGELHLSSS